MGATPQCRTGRRAKGQAENERRKWGDRPREGHAVQCVTVCTPVLLATILPSETDGKQSLRQRATGAPLMPPFHQHHLFGGSTAFRESVRLRLIVYLVLRNTKNCYLHLLTAVLTGSSSEKNISAVDVFAVPSAPTISTAFRCLCNIRSRNRARVESIVGTRRLEKSSTSVFGYSHRGGRHL